MTFCDKGCFAIVRRRRIEEYVIEKQAVVVVVGVRGFWL